MLTTKTSQFIKYLLSLYFVTGPLPGAGQWYLFAVFQTLKYFFVIFVSIYKLTSRELGQRVSQNCLQ